MEKLDKKTVNYKFFILFLSSIGLISYFYAGTISSGIETQLIQSKSYNISYVQYDLIGTIQNSGAILMCFIGGYLVDEFGSAKIFLAGLFTNCIGICLSIISSYFKNFLGILFSQAILGISQGPIQISQV